MAYLGAHRGPISGWEGRQGRPNNTEREQSSENDTDLLPL